MKHISLKQLEADRVDLEAQLMAHQEQVGLLRGALSYILLKIEACKENKKE